MPSEDTNDEFTQLKSKIKNKLKKIIPEEVTPDNKYQVENKPIKISKRRFIPYQGVTSLAFKVFPRFFEFLFEGDYKRSTNPFDLEGIIEVSTGEKPLNIVGINRTSILSK